MACYWLESQIKTLDGLLKGDFEQSSKTVGVASQLNLTYADGKAAMRHLLKALIVIFTINKDYAGDS